MGGGRGKAMTRFVAIVFAEQPIASSHVMTSSQLIGGQVRTHNV